MQSVVSQAPPVQKKWLEATLPAMNEKLGELNPKK
jgi:hypothetical protein